ncbi:Alpha/Beta hydrolase protein [Rhodocollybia butyracea]|uniref:Alpha/Beta hydrolase protein n=1 Tax=Rhodocollybia butyracea TaxID=206335 RepID=A0A9P5TVT5_9AGAR|nr:Alpha/Beta hydrolase protein [Rhodocollybia butyracea]
MPFVEVCTSTGLIKFHYTISTPTCASAQTIDPELPVVLFFHAFAFHAIFHSQFSSVLLRKFNLVVFDLRWHGYTESDTIPHFYGQEQAAEDAIAFMDAIQLPPCHFVAIDIGSMIALQVAVTRPKYVRSLFIMSHICLEEIPSVAEGRTELYNLFISGTPGAMNDVGLGYHQYAFSNRMSNLANAICAETLRINLMNWSPEHFKEYRLASYEIFLHRKAHSQQALSRISCPVKLLYGTNSVVYTPDYNHRLYESMQQARLDVSLQAVLNAPHYLCVDHGNEVNLLIHDFISQSIGDKDNVFIPTNIDSPWSAILREYGWYPERMNEFDDEFITVTFPTGSMSL